MTKLKRDAAFWARRMRMSRVRTWAIIEGTHHDAPYYESALVSGAKTTTTVLEAEDILVDGIAAGGKVHALKVFSELDRLNALQQENRQTKIDVIVFVDRDDDAFLNRMITHPNLHYTLNADVESDIVSAADLQTAVAHSYSIPRADGVKFTPSAPHESLASRWAEWIILRLASAACEWSDTRFAQPSQVNVPRFSDTVDTDVVNRISDRVRKASTQWDTEYSRARAFLESEQRVGRHGAHVKGKWLAPFILHEVEKAMRPFRAINQVKSSTLLVSCLGTIDFERLWAARFARLDVLLTR
ncbi:hypothetical protein ACTJKO_00670 [Curtobacterium sp. 22159]|uniref:hypothetical protein n=1 Tax=Curtobacterium sp. 22159 TaxID=3453882 RepID=UPI003F825B24